MHGYRVFEPEQFILKCRQVPMCRGRCTTDRNLPKCTTTFYLDDILVRSLQRNSEVQGPRGSPHRPAHSKERTRPSHLPSVRARALPSSRSGTAVHSTTSIPPVLYQLFKNATSNTRRSLRLLHHTR